MCQHDHLGLENENVGKFGNRTWGLCLVWGLAKAALGRVGGCLWFCVGEVVACCHYKTRALWHMRANGAQVSEAQAFQLLIALF